MPGNWDTFQQLKDGRVEWPTGDTDMVAMVGFAPLRVEAWAVQGGTMGAGESWEGPSQSTSWEGSSSKPGSPDRWTADTQGWIQGSFQEGPAVGIAFVASRSTAEPDTFKFNWWFDVIVLRS